jgi:hypothetical protein
MSIVTNWSTPTQVSKNTAVQKQGACINNVYYWTVSCLILEISNCLSADFAHWQLRQHSFHPLNIMKNVRQPTGI